jgi:hypothetical protein
LCKAAGVGLEHSNSRLRKQETTILNKGNLTGSDPAYVRFRPFQTLKLAPFSHDAKWPISAIRSITNADVEGRRETVRGRPPWPEG